jgi:DNA-binding transcriptional ArsR family regulator
MGSLDKRGLARLLTAIGDPARLDIIFLLGEHGELNVGQVAGHFRLSQPAISHHLKVLKDAAIVLSEKRGQEVFYQLNREYLISQLYLIADDLKAHSDRPLT